MPGCVPITERAPAPGAGEKAAVSGAGSALLLIDPSVPIRDIQTKFAVLGGLIGAREVSNRDIVETVLNLLVAGEFDLETNFIIQDADGIGCLPALLERCDVTCQAEIWSMLTAMLRKSVRNLHMSAEVELIRQLLLRMSSVDDMIADLLVEMLGVLASYSITVQEVKLLFSMLQGEGGLWPRHAVKMLAVLKQMPQRHGPDSFFNFPGRSAAAIALPPIAKWPYQNGFTFNTWFRMDPLNNINVDKDKPYLYCFRTSKGIGYSAHFVGNCLIVTSLKSKGKGFQHCVKYDFQPRKWYMISIVHVYSRWRNSEIRCYVNGQLVSYGDMAWHVNTNDSYEKCFLGSSETADANRVFCGQLGAVYVFGEALNPAQIFAIHQLGPGYKSTFKFKSESDIHLAEHHKQVLYDGKLASAIALAYNAKATDAQLCLESSPKENTSIFVHSPHALMLQDVKATVTHSIHRAIHSIGGIQVLFPLFAQLDYQQLSDSQVETAVCATLLAFLVELLKSSVAMQEQMLGGKGFLVIGYLLEKSSRAHISRSVLEQFLSFAKYLDGLPYGAPLLKQLCDHILFNAAIWIHTPAKIQLSLYTYLSSEFISTATIYGAIRRGGTVLRLMHALKYYYWAVNPADGGAIVPKGLDGPRPTQKEIISLRAFILLFLKQLILKDQGVKEDELQSILNYLLTMHEDENLHDVLQLVVALMSEHPASMIPAFDQRNGIRVIYKLMGSKCESIQVQSLKVLAYFLKHLGHKRKVEIMHTQSLFTLLGEKLLLHAGAMTVTTYNALYEILTEQVCTQVVHKPHAEPDSTVRIQNPMILKVIATLLKNSAPGAELMEIRRLFLSDMIKLFSTSRENRRCLLQCSVWQDWMFSLGYINPKTPDEQKITEMVYNIFRILLYHAIKHEWGGWRVWVDTLSIAHSKVTYEAHKEYLAKMYEEYQRQEEENIKKGKKGSVSTISGLSAQAAGITGSVGIGEMDGSSQSPGSDGADSRNPLAEGRTPEERAARAEVQHLLVDVKAEKVEATEVKMDDMDALMEVDSLLDDVYCGVMLPKSSAADRQISAPLISLDDDKDGVPQGNAFLFRKVEEASLPVLNPAQSSEPPPGGDLGLLCTLEKDEFELQGINSAEEASTPDAGRESVAAPSKGDISAVRSRSNKPSEEDGGGEMKIQTTATTQKLNGRLGAAADSADFPAGGALTDEDQQQRQRRQFSPGPRTTMFRIPEFKWSALHQRLLADLLFALESDVHVWKSHSTKSVMDFVNSSENIIFVHNTIHLISQMVDNIIIACGGILPLLSAATSPSVENIEATQGMSSETAITFLYRLMVMVDVLVFSSSLNFSEIEAEKNMSSGGLMRQCLRLVCCMAVRSCLECRQRHGDRGNRPCAPNNGKWQDVAPNAVTPGKLWSTFETVSSNPSPIKDPDRLLQDVDINRLRAVVFRDVDDSKQAQFLALAVVYFISVLMVSKYRDILEPQRETGRTSAKSGHGAHRRRDADSPSATERGQTFVGQPGRGSPSEERSVPLIEPSVTAKRVVGVVDGAADADELFAEPPPPSSSSSSGLNVKEILKSLVASPAEAVEAGLEPVSCPDLAAKVQTALPVQFHSFDRSVVVPVKKPAPGGLAVTVVGGSPSSGPVTPNIFAAASATPKSMINTMGAVDAAVACAASATPSSSALANGATSKNLPAVQTVAPMPEDTLENMSITSKLERALEKVAPLLREIFVDFAPFLSRTLLGSHGQELLIEGLVCMKSSTSVVELVMLLCSQEWQNSIQKNAGLAFIELINEGRLLCHAMKDHIVRVANEAEFILNRQRAEDVHKHAEFESNCGQYAAERREEEKMCDHLISAAKHRDHVTANQLRQKIVNILTNKRGAWGTLGQRPPHDFWRLDYWEDDLRRRRRFVRNPLGSTHLDVSCRTLQEYVTDEDELVKLKTLLFPGQSVPSQSPETELILEGDDDDSVGLLQEKEVDNLGGPVALSSPAQLVAPGLVVRGTLSISTSEIYFEVDEDDPAFKRVSPKVLAYTEGLHGKWMFSEIRAIFSRRHLLQNTAAEVFMANRTSVLFNFPDRATVKKAVHGLPRVGVGTSYGLPQDRRISLASPRQLFKSSNMTQRWQRREISNFEYLMFLNTIAGRTYNDLNQYPLFPWVLASYDSQELDLTLPANFRDLSKPVGALNPKRAAFFAERFESWADDQTPPCHYRRYCSTAGSALHWLVRMEPFATLFLSANNNRFDHPDRIFSSVARSWRNCQRDTSDVNELIPEFFYLPEMLVNANGYHLGMREDRAMVADVDLPVWAKTPEDFVRINRMALESEFVSCQLHQWIDLIFGYKQRGPEAVRALNVFHHLTYEGGVSLDAIADPLTREATEAQIRSFGQTPSHLLIEPHPPRSSAMHLSPLMFKDQLQQDVIMVLKFPSNSPVTHVAANTLPHLAVPAVVTVTCSRLFAVNRWHNTVGLRGAPGYSLEQAHHLPIEMDPLIGKLTQIVFGHWDVVTCLARSESYIGGDCYIVSGSRDATLLLWYWSGRHHIIGDNPVNSDYPAPRAVLTGHEQEVACVAVCAELGLVISGAQDGPCLVHTITGDLLRALEAPERWRRPRLISVSSEGHCVIYYERGRFCNFSINGKLLARMELDDSSRAILLSSDGHNLVTGGDNGAVQVWQACSLKPLYVYPACDAAIRAMDLSHDQRTLITGMASGSIVAFNIDFNRWHYEHQHRY
ncbi:neurobeachin isoform X3 [Phyllopteryx taeniolatus]|uniref:neurobeachin isoform X3 n=1 Tax=Phyllopteryx taeniolatus TaxID=161469 RepID=UPI002AD57EAD|nr:neurobeachin isoform X3 [Phyllopteryx taeniolatus]